MEKWSYKVGCGWVLWVWWGGGSVWAMGEWAVGYWIEGVTSIQKIYGLYGLKHHTVEISVDVTEAGRTTRKDRATQLLICAQCTMS